MSKLQDFAKSQFGIELTPAQIEMIEAWSDNKILIKPRNMGVSTANKIARAYLKDGVKDDNAAQHTRLAEGRCMSKKLYVVGESTPNPEKWSIWSEWALVLASSPEEAQELSGRQGEAVCEIPLDNSLLLVSQTEPNFGADL